MEQFRQLAAIMFTDIVGYTSLMGEDEVKSLELLKKNRLIQKPIIKKFKGKWIKEIGDGVLAIFNTVSDAVYCAVDIQNACESEPELKLRIGIHQGEVVILNEDVFGDGVNIASRIESIAPAGCIYVSESVLRDVENKKGIDAEFVVEKTLKNVKHPVKIYQIKSEGQSNIVESDDRIAIPNQVSEKSIAVLPFVNMSSDPEQEYFSDGLTEEIITDLSQLAKLLVISRSSIMAFKGSNKGVKEISNELHVRYILEGSVRKSGNSLRISAQLIDALTDGHLWAEKYNGTLEDVFEIQEKVSRSIVSSLKIKLTKEESKKLAESPISNSQAYELYQKAQFELYRFNEDGLNRALQYLDNALKIQGENVLIYSKMGMVFLNLMNVLSKIDLNYIKKAQKVADKIFNLDANSPMGHTILGFIAFYEGNIKQAVAQLNTAYSANATNHDNLWLLILGNFYLGRYEQAEKYTKIMRKVDPYNPVYYALLSLTCYMKGDLNQASKEISNALKIYPEIPQVQLYYAYFLVANRNKKNEAIQTLDQLIQRTSGSIFSVLGTLFKHALQGKELGGILTHEVIEKLQIDVEWSWLIADFYSISFKLEEAIDWLEYTVSRGFINYPLFAEYDPFLKNIRNEERYLKLMKIVKNKWENVDD